MTRSPVERITFPRRRLVSGKRPILSPDAAMMSLDDLSRDRQSQPRILAKSLHRPVRIEALENSLQRVRRDAWTVVIDLDNDAIARRLVCGRLFTRDATKANAHFAASL